MSRFIRKEISRYTSANEETVLFAEIDTNSGKSKIVVKKIIYENFSVVFIKEAEELYRKLTDDCAVRLKLSDLADGI